MSASAPSVASVTRRYGLRYEGFTSSVPAHLCPVNKLWGKLSTAGTPGSETSFNLLYDPGEGKFFRRAGSTPIGGTNGILESGPASMRARKMIALHSPSIEDLGDSYPTHCVLYTQESATAANNNAALYLRSTIGSINYTLGMEFSANHYPGTNDATFNIKCPPYYRTTDGVWGRLATATTRQYALAGSRGMQEVGDWLFFGCKDATPLKWNKRYNESTGSGTQNLRLFPTGGIPPSHYPTVTAGTTNTNPAPWQDGDVFFFGMAFQNADGSVSFPSIPRDVNDELPSGFCKYTIPASVGYRNFIQWTNVHKGPDGTVGRWLLRTPKFNSTAAVGTAPSIKDLKVVEYIPNNTSINFLRDYKGNDLDLRDLPDKIRFDRIWQPAARYISNFDGRNIVGYTKPNPAAILISVDSFINSVDEISTGAASPKYEFDVGFTSANKLTIYEDGVQVAQYDTTSTIQKLVDLINATATFASTATLRASVVPGADASAAGALAVTTGVNTGDTSGRVRFWGPALPGIMFFSTTYLANFPVAKRRWFFTQGGPDVPANLPDSYLAGNYRTGLDSWGILMGFAPLAEGCLILFSRAIVLFANQNGRSGLDDDYHPVDLFTNIGCIAWDSIAVGDGWAGCLTEQGYFVFDGTRAGIANISGDLWNPATQVGEWAYEIAQCSAATASDSDGAHFHAKVMGNILRCTWRSDSGVTIPNRYAEYNFSLSANGAGLAEVLKPDGTPWGWSPPSGLSISVMGEVRKSGGITRYGCIESNAGATNGRVDQIETGTTDNSVAIAADAWGPIDFAESLDKKSAQQVNVVYKVNGTGAKLHFRRTDGTTTVVETGSGLALPTTGSSGTFAALVVPLPQTARSQSLGNQIRISDDGAGGALELFGMELDEVIGSPY